jgi:hypothetical protein
MFARFTADCETDVYKAAIGSITAYLTGTDVRMTAGSHIVHRKAAWRRQIHRVPGTGDGNKP